MLMTKVHRRLSKNRAIVEIFQFVIVDENGPPSVGKFATCKNTLEIGENFVTLFNFSSQNGRRRRIVQNFNLRSRLRVSVDGKIHQWIFTSTRKSNEKLIKPRWKKMQSTKLIMGFYTDGCRQFPMRRDETFYILDSVLNQLPHIRSISHFTAIQLLDMLILKLISCLGFFSNCWRIKLASGTFSVQYLNSAE